MLLESSLWPSEPSPRDCNEHNRFLKSDERLRHQRRPQVIFALAVGGVTFLGCAPDRDDVAPGVRIGIQEYWDRDGVLDLQLHDCGGEPYDITLDYSVDAVTIDVRRTVSYSADVRTACASVVQVVLDEPIDDRALNDGFGEVTQAQ